MPYILCQKKIGFSKGLVDYFFKGSSVPYFDTANHDSNSTSLLNVSEEQILCWTKTGFE